MLVLKKVNTEKWYKGYKTTTKVNKFRAHLRVVATHLVRKPAAASRYSGAPHSAAAPLQSAQHTRCPLTSLKAVHIRTSAPQRARKNRAALKRTDTHRSTHNNNNNNSCKHGSSQQQWTHLGCRRPPSHDRGVHSSSASPATRSPSSLERPSACSSVC